MILGRRRQETRSKILWHLYEVNLAPHPHEVPTSVETIAEDLGLPVQDVVVELDYLRQKGLVHQQAFGIGEPEWIVITAAGQDAVEQPETVSDPGVRTIMNNIINAHGSQFGSVQIAGAESQQTSTVTISGATLHQSL